MTTKDEGIYGFSKQDANDILRSAIVAREKIISGQRRQASVVTMFVAQLTGSWSSRTATADISTLDGVDWTLLEEDATIYDPLSIFGTLASGDYCYVLKQNGKYYAIQAPCPS